MKKRASLRRICLYALFSAMLCAISPIAIPIGAVPISFSLLGVMLCCVMLGVRAIIPVAVYLAIGAVGVPVFAGGGAGFGVLIGPTGGFLWAYLPMCVLTGMGHRMIASRVSAAKIRFLLTFAAGFCGVLLCYLCGTLQYMLVANVSFLSAAGVCVLPFLLFDFCKLVILGVVENRLQRVSLIRGLMTDL